MSAPSGPVRRRPEHLHLLLPEGVFDGGTRRSLIEADSKRLSLELERGAAQRAELVVQHKWAERDYEERQRQAADNVTYIGRVASSSPMLAD